MFLDFLRGDRTISIKSTSELSSSTETGVKKDDNWCLYTLNPESLTCPLYCIIISNYFKFIKPIRQKIVECSSCSPNGILPILVAESDGRVIECAEIIKTFFDIEDISLYAGIDGLIGGYIRSFSNEKLSSNLRAVDVIEFIESFEPTLILDQVTTVLLFSMVQGSKIHLKHTDPVRMSIERNEFLTNLFINLMETLK